jgi:hypothetical protein
MGDEAATVEVNVWPVVRHKCGQEIKDVKFLKDRDGTQVTCKDCLKTFTYRRQAPNPMYASCLGAVEPQEPSRR